MESVSTPAHARLLLIWKFMNIAVCVIPFALLLVAFLTYSEWSMLLTLLVVLVFFMGIFMWLRTMLSMDRFSKEKRTPARWGALFIYFSASISLLAASLFAVRGNVPLQFTASLFSSVGTWFAFLSVFEGIIRIPSRQQWGSLLNIFVLSFLYEVRVYIINAELKS